MIFALTHSHRLKELRKQSKPQVSIIPEKRTNVVAMSIVEDFMYLNTSSSTSYLETQQTDGLVAGSLDLLTMLLKARPLHAGSAFFLLQKTMVCARRALQHVVGGRSLSQGPLYAMKDGWGISN
ncbi:hypothetical protein R6Q57_017967 [Mikania cordata]